MSLVGLYLYDKKYDDAVQGLLGLHNMSWISELRGHSRVILKPNIVNPDKKTPCSTDPLFIEALIKSIREQVPDIDIVIAESSGSRRLEAKDWEFLGYSRLSTDYPNIMLWNIDMGPVEPSINPNTPKGILQTFMKPTILNGAYLISCAVLKRHSLMKYTGACKNLFGLANSNDYGKPDHATKWKLHDLGVAESIVAINMHCPINMSFVDGSIGSVEEGSTKYLDFDYPIIAMGMDPVAVDEVCARILGIKKLDYLELAKDFGVGGVEPIDLKIVGTDPGKVEKAMANIFKQKLPKQGMIRAAEILRQMGNFLLKRS